MYFSTGTSTMRSTGTAVSTSLIRTLRVSCFGGGACICIGGGEKDWTCAVGCWLGVARGGMLCAVCCLMSSVRCLLCDVRCV